MTDPKFDSNNVATATPYVNQGSDGKTIGYYNAGQIKTAVNTIKANYFNVYQQDNKLIVTGVPESASYQLIDLNGKLLKKDIIDNGIININSLKQGVYLFRVGEETSKLIIR